MEVSPADIDERKADNSILSIWLKRWELNFCINLPKLAILPTIDNVSFKNVPACVIGPGPSLEKSIGHLHLLNGRGLLIALQRSYKILIDNNVYPDVVIVVDAADFVIDHFKDCPIEKLPLLLLDMACSRFLFDLNPINILTYDGRNKTMSSYLYDLLPSVAYVLAGYTVSSLAVSVADSWGCDPILMTGVDLGSDSNRYTSSNVKLQEKDPKKQLYLPKWGAKGYLKSAPDLCLTHHWLERFSMLKKHTFFVQCSEGGAFLGGRWKHRKLHKMLGVLKSKDIDLGIKYKLRSDQFTRNKLLGKLPRHIDELLLKASEYWPD